MVNKRFSKKRFSKSTSHNIVRLKDDREEKQTDGGGMCPHVDNTFNKEIITTNTTSTARFEQLIGPMHVWSLW